MLRLPCLATRTPAPADHEGRCRRDVEGAAGVAAGAASIDAARRVRYRWVEAEVSPRLRGRAAARMASANPTISSTVSPFMCRATSSAAIWASEHLPVENFGHHLVRLFSREGLMVIGDAMQGVNNHAGNPQISIAAESCRTLDSPGGRLRSIPGVISRDAAAAVATAATNLNAKPAATIGRSGVLLSDAAGGHA